MEVKNKKNYSTPGWKVPPKELETFRLITDLNRSQAIVYGRIVYIIRESVYRGCFSIDPHFTQGWIHYPFKPFMGKKESHFKTYIKDNQDYSQYVTSNKALLDKFIGEKSLYLNPTDPILTYKIE